MSAALLLAATLAYGLAALLHVLAQRRRRLRRPAAVLTAVAVALQALLLLSQAMRGMPPDAFDWLQAALFAFVAVYGVWRGEGGGAIVLPVAFVAMALSALLRRGGGPSPLQGSWLLWLHVGFLAVGFACLAVAGATALLRRLAEMKLRRGTLGAIAALPDLQAAVQRFLGAGLACDAVGIAFGSLYARQAWGSYWSWNGKETATLAVWAVDLAAFLAVRAGRRLALGDWLAAAGLVGMLANLWAVGSLPGPHRFNW
jgi:ABC-type transport system involved in cytochrome c biogenesis permease subunit